MKNIYLIRHCKAEGQEPEARLTIEGQQQAKELSKLLSPLQIELIVTSPYKRAMDTIQPFCNQANIPCLTDSRLEERVLSTTNLDNWMDKLKDTYLHLDLKYEGGESSQEAMDRGIQVIHEMLARPERNIALVTHGALMSLMIKFYQSEFGFEDWLKLTNPDVYRISIDEKAFRVNRIMNDAI